MITITIEIAEEGIIDDFAKSQGYREVDALSGEPNKLTTTEFVKNILVKTITRGVSKKRADDHFQAVIKNVENDLVAKII